MIRNYFLINVLLLVIIVFLGLKFHEVYSQSATMPQGAAAEDAQKEQDAVSAEEKALDSSAFQIISNMDLFRPARSPYKEDASKQQAVPKIPPRLFGTVILGDEKSAILEDPNTKSTRVYRVNETVGPFTISDIQEDKVVLLADGEKSEVRLREEKKGLPPVKQMVIPQQQMQPPPQQPQQQIQPQIQQQPPQRPVPQRPVPQRPIPPQPAQRR